MLKLKIYILFIYFMVHHKYKKDHAMVHHKYKKDHATRLPYTNRLKSLV